LKLPELSLFRASGRDMVEALAPGLSPRLKVSGDVAEPFEGRLGLLVYDQSVDQVVALTAGQLASGATQLYHDSGGVAVTSHNAFPLPEGAAETKAQTLIAPLVVYSGQLLSPTQLISASGRPHEKPQFHADMTAILGEEVLIQTSERSPLRAVLHSLNGQFLMPVGASSDLTFIDGALEMTSLDGSHLTSHGDAGAVVTTLRGDPIGIVVCGIEDTAFAAPLEGAIAALGDCAPVSADVATRWNARIGRDAGGWVKVWVEDVSARLPPKSEWQGRASWDAISAEGDGDDQAMLEWSLVAAKEGF